MTEREEAKRRHGLIQKGMKEAGLDLLLVASDWKHKGNLRYLAGRILWSRWAYIIFRVGKPSLNIRCQVRRFFVMIREWMVLRVIFNSEVRGVLGGVIELDDTLESQVIAHTIKIDVRNAIPEEGRQLRRPLRICDGSCAPLQCP